MKKPSFFSELIKGHRIRFSIALFTKICTTILGIGLTYVIKYIVDTVFYSNSYKALIGILLVFLGLRVLIMVLTYFSSYSLNFIGQKIAFDLRQKGFKKILSLDFKYFDSHRTGDLMTRMTSDIDFVQSFYSAALPNAISQAIAFVSSLFMMLFSGGPFVLMLLLFVLPTLAILAATLSKEIRPAHKRIREMRARLNTVVQENISANRVVKAFCNEDFEIEKLKRANADFKNANIKANDISRKYGPVMGKLHDLFNLYIIVVGGILTIKGYMTVGEIVMFNSLVWRVTAPLTTFSNVVNEFSNISASGDKIKEFLNEQPEITNHPEVKKEKLYGDILFDHVTFNYENEGALRGVTFRIDRGQKIGIVGSTGSGKSTVINLIDRFYEPTGGRILIDGEDIRKIDLELLRGSVSVSQQDVFLFSESIAKNIAYGHPGAKMDDIIKAAKMAKAHDFISRLPEGYDTIIGERGLGLSGGQKQRITLARAILKNPSILILDDTTSALDADTEKYIQNQINTKLKDKTVIIISQRISSVKDCDQILVFEDGKITERGTHNELVLNKGFYYNIYKQQFSSKQSGTEVHYNG